MDNVKFIIGIALCVIAAISFLLSGVVEFAISLPIILLILGIILIATGRKQK